MLRDCRSLPSSAKPRADICIVGAGPAGIALARRLSERGVRVLLLESGGLSPDPRAQELAQGEVLGDPYWALETSRVRGFGGTSQHWTGWCRPLDATDFATRPWVEYSGWPFGFEELRTYYGQAQSLADLGAFDYSAASWFHKLRRATPPLESDDFRSIIWQLSRPTHFGQKYRDEFDSDPNIDVLLGATVLALVRRERGKRVDRAMVADADGRIFEVHAQSFVLAAGGIDNARLLLTSEHAGQALGNENDLVGRFFLEHPHSNIGILSCHASADGLRLYEAVHDVDGGRPAAVRAALALTAEAQRSERLLNFSVILEPMLRAPPFSAAHAQASARLAELRGSPERRSLELSVRTEQQPSAESRVVLLRARDRFGVRRTGLEWRHHPQTLRTIRRGVELLARSFARLGLGHVYSYAHADARPKTAPPGSFPELWGGHHHMGTTRMHDDPRFGVVDRDCRVHSLENLFVAGSSVFPTGGYANPTLTLLALALRLGDRLARMPS